MRTEGTSRLVTVLHIPWSYIALHVPYGGFRQHSKSVSRCGSPHHLALRCWLWGNLCVLIICAENSGESGSLCLQSVWGCHCQFLVTEENDLFVSVGGTTVAWSYCPGSGTLKSHEWGAAQWWCWPFSWHPGHSLGSYHTKHLTANGDTDVLGQGSCECLQMGDGGYL